MSGPALAFAALLAGAAATGGLPPEAAGLAVTEPALVFRFTFEEPPTRAGGLAVYPAQGGFEGTVRAGQGGDVTRVRVSPLETAGRFPGPCDGSGCPRALLEVSDDSRLDPAGEEFSFGARVVLLPEETAPGSNIVQKGRFATDGGVWKLQVDGAQGQPSCLFRSDRPAAGGGSVLVTSPLSVADGEWHTLTCRRTDDFVAIVVDGQAERETAAVAPIFNDAPVRVGSSGVQPGDDQFHGRLDDVFLSIRRD